MDNSCLRNHEVYRRKVTRHSLTVPVSPEAVRLNALAAEDEVTEIQRKQDTVKPCHASNGGGPFNTRHLTRRYYLSLLLIQTWASLLSFGFLPAIQSYSCLPYGPRTLHLAVTLCGIAYPAACALAMFVVLRRMPHLCAQTLLGTLGAAYITLTAATSPTPPLVDTDAGAFLVVLFWVATFLVLSYAKTMVTLVLASHGEKALFWLGACTQLGALVGSLVPYLLVSHLRLFTERDHCADA